MMMLVAAGLVPKQSLRLIVPPNWERGFEKREAPCLLDDTGKKAQELGEEGDDCACVMKGALGNGSRAVIVTRLARSTFSPTPPPVGRTEFTHYAASFFPSCFQLKRIR